MNQRQKREIRIYLGNKALSVFIEVGFFPLSLPTIYLSNPFISLHLSVACLSGISFNINLCQFRPALSLLPLRIAINLTRKSLPFSPSSLNKFWLLDCLSFLLYLLCDAPFPNRDRHSSGTEYFKKMCHW